MILSWVAVVALCASAAGEARDTGLTAAGRQMRKTIVPQTDNSHLTRLAALRTLRDPELEPLFRALSQHDHWPMQVHGVLGLGELDGSVLHPTLLASLDPRAQEQAMLVALADPHLTDAQLVSLLDVPKLAPHLESMLLDEAIARELSVETDKLVRLLASGDPRATGCASMLLAARDHAGAVGSLDQHLMGWAEPRQLEATFAALDTLGRHPSRSGRDWAQELLEAETRSGPRRFALLTLLKVDQPTGDQRWQEAMSRATRHRERVDLALLRLMAKAPFPTQSRGLLHDEPLLKCIADASDAVAGAQSGNPDALVALVDTQHGRSIEWLLDNAADLPSVLVQPSLERLIEQAPGEGRTHAAAIDRAMRGALVLHGINAPRMRQLLADAPDDGPRQQALLLAALQLQDPQLVDVVDGLRQIGLGTADAMALLVRARGHQTLPDIDMGKLALTVDGAGLSDPLRTQAAWLLLRHTGMTASVADFGNETN
jgi:hypothetical protein